MELTLRIRNHPITHEQRQGNTVILSPNRDGELISHVIIRGPEEVMERIKELIKEEYNNDETYVY